MMTKTYKLMLRQIKVIALRGKRFSCPVCQKTFRKFLSTGVVRRKNARCPNCDSFERHRLLRVALDVFFKNKVIKPGGKLLHIAPEPCLTKKLKTEFEYTSIDIDAKKAMISMDITNLNFPDNTFDAIICNHVLEHIPNDYKAMGELYRVLKKNSWANIQVPIKGNKTKEDINITDPLERERLYGDKDHVRYYGRDFVERLSRIGFYVQIVPKNELLTPVELNRISVDIEDGVILCFKN